MLRVTDHTHKAVPFPTTGVIEVRIVIEILVRVGRHLEVGRHFRFGPLVTRSIRLRTISREERVNVKEDEVFLDCLLISMSSSSSVTIRLQKRSRFIINAVEEEYIFH